MEVHNQFEPNTPKIASEVNENFQQLDDTNQALSASTANAISTLAHQNPNPQGVKLSFPSLQSPPAPLRLEIYLETALCCINP